MACVNAEVQFRRLFVAMITFDAEANRGTQTWERLPAFVCLLLDNDLVR